MLHGITDSERIKREISCGTARDIVILGVGQTGAIIVNELLMTSDDLIYAAGDCIEVLNVISKKPVNLPLGSLANRQGRVAGTNAAGGKHRFGAITGTTAIRVFDYNLAKSGLNEREAVKAGFDPVSSYLPDYDRDPFIQDARMINIKMTADRVIQKILGVQIVGEGEVAKRIDVAAAVIVKAGTLSDIIALDLGYTPPYSQAIYEAALILKANGFKTVRILEGGLRMWPFEMARE